MSMQEVNLIRGAIDCRQGHDDATSLRTRCQKTGRDQIGREAVCFETDRARAASAEAMTHYTILYYTILYYTILYFTILYDTIIYNTLIYYTIPYHTMLYCTLCYAIRAALEMASSSSARAFWRTSHSESVSLHLSFGGGARLASLAATAKNMHPHCHSTINEQSKAHGTESCERVELRGRLSSRSAATL